MEQEHFLTRPSEILLCDKRRVRILDLTSLGDRLDVAVSTSRVSDFRGTQQDRVWPLSFPSKGEDASGT